MNNEKLDEEIEKYRIYFEEFADEFGYLINSLLGYSDNVNLCINIAWMMGFLKGKKLGGEEFYEEFRKKLIKRINDDDKK